MRLNNTKTLSCKVCDEDVNNVGRDAEKVTCSACVQRSLREFDEQNPYSKDVQNNTGNSK